METANFLPQQGSRPHRGGSNLFQIFKLFKLFKMSNSLNSLNSLKGIDSCESCGVSGVSESTCALLAQELTLTHSVFFLSFFFSLALSLSLSLSLSPDMTFVASKSMTFVASQSNQAAQPPKSWADLTEEGGEDELIILPKLMGPNWVGTGHGVWQKKEGTKEHPSEDEENEEKEEEEEVEEEENEKVKECASEGCTHLTPNELCKTCTRMRDPAQMLCPNWRLDRGGGVSQWLGDDDEEEEENEEEEEEEKEEEEEEEDAEEEVVGESGGDGV